MIKVKIIKVICIVLAICLLLSAILFIVCRKEEVREDEILRAALGLSGGTYMVLYENGDFVVEHGISTHGDISKKPYITKKKIKLEGKTYHVYSRMEMKLEPAEVEKIKELAKNLDYIPSDDWEIYDATPAKFYYNGRKIECSNYRDFRRVEELVEELKKVLPIGFSEGAA